MKTFPILFALVLSTSALANPPAAPANPHQQPMMGNPHAGQMNPAVPLTNSGTVVSSIDVPMFTYIEVLKDKKKMWLAAVTTKVKKGDTVRFDQGMVMKDFQSKTLNRKFPEIVFVNRLVVDNKKK